MIDKRAVFFVVSAIVSLAMMPLLPEDPDHPWLHLTPVALIVALLLLAVLSWIDHWSRHRDFD